jgi:hypothetical protein
MPVNRFPRFFVSGYDAPRTNPSAAGCMETEDDNDFAAARRRRDRLQGRTCRQRPCSRPGRARPSCRRGRMASASSRAELIRGAPEPAGSYRVGRGIGRSTAASRNPNSPTSRRPAAGRHVELHPSRRLTIAHECGALGGTVSPEVGAQRHERKMEMKSQHHDAKTAPRDRELVTVELEWIAAAGSPATTGGSSGSGNRSGSN